MTAFHPLTSESSEQQQARLGAELIRANQELEKWTVFRDSITDRLKALHTAGVIPTSFEADGYSIRLSPGRPTKQCDKAAKETRAALDERLIAEGHITLATGQPFWTTRKLKS